MTAHGNAAAAAIHTSGQVTDDSVVIHTPIMAPHHAAASTTKIIDVSLPHLVVSPLGAYPSGSLVEPASSQGRRK
jgi:hypothetical protein